MSQFVREFLSLNSAGWTRAELKKVVQDQPRFGARIQQSPAAYSQLISRLIDRGEIEEKNGKLFAAPHVRLAIVVRKERFELACPISSLSDGRVDIADQ